MSLLQVIVYPSELFNILVKPRHLLASYTVCFFLILEGRMTHIVLNPRPFVYFRHDIASFLSTSDKK